MTSSLTVSSDCAQHTHTCFVVYLCVFSCLCANLTVRFPWCVSQFTLTLFCRCSSVSAASHFIFQTLSLFQAFSFICAASFCFALGFSLWLTIIWTAFFTSLHLPAILPGFFEFFIFDLCCISFYLKFSLCSCCTQLFLIKPTSWAESTIMYFEGHNLAKIPTNKNTKDCIPRSTWTSFYLWEMSQCLLTLQTMVSGCFHEHVSF